MAHPAATPTMKKYMGWMVLVMAAYVIAIVVVALLLRRADIVGPARYALAVLPALPLVALIWGHGHYVAHEADEFERSVVVQSLLWATGVTLSLATVWGFLEEFADVARLPLWSLPPIFSTVYGVAQAFVRRRYA